VLLTHPAEVNLYRYFPPCRHVPLIFVLPLDSAQYRVLNTICPPILSSLPQEGAAIRMMAPSSPRSLFSSVIAFLVYKPRFGAGSEGGAHFSQTHAASVGPQARPAP